MLEHLQYRVDVSWVCRVDVDGRSEAFEGCLEFVTCDVMREVRAVERDGDVYYNWVRGG